MRLDRETLELLLLIRQFEERLLALFQAGRLNGTTHTCLGQEAIPVTVMPLLHEGDFVFSNHRGHGHYLARFRDPEGLLAEIMGREGAICGGVGGSQHIRRGRYFSTGVQGESLPVAAGAALQQKREGHGGIAVAFIGDGTWGQGAVYEALNMASLWQLPLVVIVENNDIAQTTPRSLNMAGTIAARARGFGVEYLGCSGCDVNALRARVAPAIEEVRHARRPLVIEFVTQRLGSHSKGDDTRSAEEVAAMRTQDWYALARAENPEMVAEAELQIETRISELVQTMESRPPAQVREMPRIPWGTGSAHPRPDGKERVLDNLNRSIRELMTADPRVVFLGEDILDPYGGAFKVARGLSTQFPDRVLTTPISELGIAGVGNGLAMAGQHPIVEFMFGDFIFLAFDQIVNFAAKSVTMYGERVPHPILYRCPVGGHRGYGATHSQTVQKHFIGVANLDLYELSPVHDCAALLPAIFERGNPAVLFESKTLYAQDSVQLGSIDELFTLEPLDDWTVRASINPSPEVLVITGGGMFYSCLKAGRALFFEHEIELQIVVPFRLYPFDVPSVAPLAMAAKAIYIVEESTAGGTWGTEVSATLTRALPGLKTPIRLIHSLDSIIPSARHLEYEVLVQSDWIVQRISQDLLHAADSRSHD